MLLEATQRTANHLSSWRIFLRLLHLRKKNTNLFSPCNYVETAMRNVTYRAFSHDVTAAILVFQNNETAAMLMYQQNPLGVERFSRVNALFCSNKLA